VTLRQARGLPILCLLPLLVLSSSKDALAWHKGGASGGSPQWWQMHIGDGGQTDNLVIAPDNTTLVATNTYGGYLWNASCASPGNAGGSGCWQQLVTATSMPSADTTPGTGFSNYGVYAFGVPASNTQDFYMVWTDGCVYVSTNRGTNWTKENLTCDTSVNPNGNYNNQAPNIAVDPQNPNFVLVAFPTNGVYYSVNATAGASSAWTQVSTSTIPGGGGVNDLVVFNGASSTGSCPSGGGTCTQGIWASSYNHGIYYSSNAGTSWAALSGAPTTQEKLLVDASGNLWVLDNSGGNTPFWKCSTASCSNETGWPSCNGEACVSLAVNPSNANDMVINRYIHGAFEYSTNGGSSWTAITNYYASYNSTSSDVPWLAQTLNNTPPGCTGPTCAGFSIADIRFDYSGNLWMTEGIGVWETTFSSIANNAWTSQSAGIEMLVGVQVISPPGYGPLAEFWDKQIFAVSPNLTTHKADYPTVHGGSYHCGISIGAGADWVGGTPGTVIENSVSNNVPTCDSYGSVQAAVSTDGGSTWTPFAAYPSEVSTYYGGAMAAGSATNWVWSLANCGDPFYTTNAGAAWTEINLPSGISAHDCGWNDVSVNSGYGLRVNLIADKVANGVFYMYNSGTAEPGIYKSNAAIGSPAGSTWVKMYSGHLVGSNDGGGGLEMQANPAKAGDFLVTQGFIGGNPVAHPYECVDSNPTGSATSTLTCTAITSIGQAWSIGWGAASAGNPTQSAIVYYGFNSSNQWGTFISYNDGSTWTNLTPNGWAANSIDHVQSVVGDSSTPGAVYECFQGSGCAYYH
jgi:xyloglucan-specific exo-beta-1,4-glucanase